CQSPGACRSRLDRDREHRIIECLSAQSGVLGQCHLSGRGRAQLSKMYQHILIPLENSPADETILQHIRGLARLTGGRLTLVHVADGFMARNQEQLGLDESAEMREDRAYLEQRQDELAAEGFKVDYLLACGEPTK